MKKIIVIITAVMISSAGFGQVMLPADTTLKANKIVHKQPDRIEMKDNKIWVIKNDEKTELAGDITLTDGTLVMKNGIVKVPAGKTTVMKNGDCIYMTGKWEKKKEMDANKKDSTK